MTSGTTLLHNVEAVSFDAYGTLVDLHAGRERSMAAVLGERAPAYVDRLWQGTLRRVVQYLLSLNGHNRFCTVKHIFHDCFRDSLAELELTDIDPRLAVAAMVELHRSAPLYPDSAAALTRLAARGPICLSSDIDDDMLATCLLPLGFRCLVTSEGVQEYKIQPGGRFFRRVLAQLELPPAAVLHVGDSPSDVIGAKRWGLKAVWLNRRPGWAWPVPAVPPDAVIHSLDELV